MKKLLLLLLIISIVFLIFFGCEGQVPSEEEGENESTGAEETNGPSSAPNSGDGTPDGPGWS